LKNFIIEPFVAHEDSEEMYCAIYSTKTGDRMLFYHQGGVDVGDVDAKASFCDIPVGEVPEKGTGNHNCIL